MAQIGASTKKVPKVRTKAEEVAHKLTRRIFLERLQKGTKLPSGHELAAEFGVAISVVREAIKRLEALGIVRSWRGSGVYVQEIDFYRSVDMFDSLLTLEDGTLNTEYLFELAEFTDDFVCLSVRLAAMHRTDEDLKSIEELFEQWSSSRDNPEKLAESANALYHAIMVATHNRVCLSLYRVVRGPWMKLLGLLESTVYGDFESEQKVLSRLIEAVEEKDPMLAEAAVARPWRRFCSLWNRPEIQTVAEIVRDNGD